MSLSLEQQYKTLSLCGIKLRAGLTVEHLLTSVERETFEEEPYTLLLSVMGRELEVEPFEYASDDIWCFDVECIEDHNDYIRIAERLRDLAGGAFPLEEIKDFVDIEQRKAWLSFRLDGKSYEWPASVVDDYADPQILSQFAQLFVDRQTEKRFTIFDLGGQACLIGCGNSDQLAKLTDRTQLKFEWLT
jgi:hypothetical protein